jgi:hypothetical protein
MYIYVCRYVCVGGEGRRSHVCMYVCMYVCMCVYVLGGRYVQVCMGGGVCAYECAYLCVYVGRYECMYVSVCVYIHINMGGLRERENYIKRTRKKMDGVNA